MQRLKVKNTHPANLLSFVVVRGGHGVSLWRKTLPGAAAFSSSLQSMRLCCSFPIAVCIQIVSASWGFECVYQRRARLCCDRLDSELFWVNSGTENNPSLPARPDLFCHFSQSCAHWYSCSCYSLQSAAEEVWLMATLRAIFLWFIK